VPNKKRLSKQFTYLKAKELLYTPVYFLNTMMAVEGTRWTKNPKMRRIRELLDQEK
jgi:hypothetical protein